MLPLVSKLLESNAAVTDLVGQAVFRHGVAPQGTQRPYITWFLVANNPIAQLSTAPCTDFDVVQIDVWSEKDADVERIAYAVRDALDQAGHENRLIISTFDNETKLYRLGIQATFIKHRPD